MALAGSGLFLRAATKLETRRLTGIGAGRRATDVQKTITVDAAIEDVFEFWTSYDNFPRFISRVLDVQPSGRAFGVDPKSSLDADLARMKTLLETGRAARDAAQPDWRP